MDVKYIPIWLTMLIRESFSDTNRNNPVSSIGIIPIPLVACIFVWLGIFVTSLLIGSIVTGKYKKSKKVSRVLERNHSIKKSNNKNNVKFKHKTFRNLSPSSMDRRVRGENVNNRNYNSCLPNPMSSKQKNNDESKVGNNKLQTQTFYPNQLHYPDHNPSEFQNFNQPIYNQKIDLQQEQIKKCKELWNTLERDIPRIGKIPCEHLVISNNASLSNDLSEHPHIYQLDNYALQNSKLDSSDTKFENETSRNMQNKADKTNYNKVLDMPNKIDRLPTLPEESTNDKWDFMGKNQTQNDNIEYHPYSEVLVDSLTQNRSDKNVTFVPQTYNIKTPEHRNHQVKDPVNSNNQIFSYPQMPNLIINNYTCSQAPRKKYSSQTSSSETTCSNDRRCKSCHEQEIYTIPCCNHQCITKTQSKSSKHRNKSRNPCYITRYYCPSNRTICDPSRHAQNNKNCQKLLCANQQPQNLDLNQFMMNPNWNQQPQNQNLNQAPVNPNWIQQPKNINLMHYPPNPLWNQVGQNINFKKLSDEKSTEAANRTNKQQFDQSTQGTHRTNKQQFDQSTQGTHRTTKQQFDQSTQGTNRTNKQQFDQLTQGTQLTKDQLLTEPDNYRPVQLDSSSQNSKTNTKHFSFNTGVTANLNLEPTDSSSQNQVELNQNKQVERKKSAGFLGFLKHKFNKKQT